MPTTESGKPTLSTSNLSRVDVVAQHADEALEALIAYDDYGAKPVKPNDLETIRIRCRDYIKECRDTGNLPRITGLAARLGVTRSKLNHWLKDSNYPDTQEYLNFVKSLFADIMEQAALDGSVDKIMAMFLLKSTHEYQEATKVIVEPQPSPYGEELSDEEIAEIIED